SEWAGLVPANTPFLAWRFTAYYPLLVVPTQEFVHRGVVQTGTRFNLDPGRWRSLKVVLYSTAVFAFVHLFRPPLLAAAVVVPSILWGFAFEKDRTLIGVMLSHAVLGWFTLEVLSLDKVVGL